jgi:signal transduction histidine kinase
MTERSDQRRAAEAARTLASFKTQAEELKAELARLRKLLAQAHEGLGSSRQAQLLEANEQLVLAALKAQTVAELAVRHEVGVLPLPQQAAVRQAFAMAEHELHLSDLREANEQLVMAALTAQELEVQAGDERGRQLKFLAMVAHELRNPLTPIRTATALLGQAGSNQPMLAELQAVIERQVMQMSRLVEDLLDGSRVNAGKFRLHSSLVDLSAVIAAAVETCRPAIVGRLQHLRLQVPDQALTLHGDAARLAQVFGNLLDNASKYTHVGGDITLTAAAFADQLTVRVRDNGIGISAEALPHVFDLFVQDPRASELHRGGLGIGLAVVRDLVESHGGRVTVSSAGLDKGSEFVVSLPRAEAPAPAQ